uniref:Uncharacterized protein n=1 Tax=Sphingobacterium sp. (strain 21) TaxID=743722 RepID=F4C442_SPHS2
MKKVTVEITENSYRTTVELDDHKMISSWKNTNYGATGTGDSFEDHDCIYPDLLDALENVDMAAYEVMKGLRNNP